MSVSPAKKADAAARLQGRRARLQARWVRFFGGEPGTILAAPRRVERPGKRYLGDSVYARVDEYGDLVLTTENGLGPSNTIILNADVYEALKLFMEAGNL